jgi:hypothetical protein
MGRRKCSMQGGGAEYLVGDVDGLCGVVLTDAAGHKEAFDPGDDHGDTGPREQKIDDAGGVAAEIEVMDSDAAKEERRRSRLCWRACIRRRTRHADARSCLRCRWNRWSACSFLSKLTKRCTRRDEAGFPIGSIELQLTE